MLLVLARGMFVASMLSAFGAALFGAVIAKPSHVGRDEVKVSDRLRRCFRVSAAAVLAFGFAWLVLEARDIAGAESIADAPIADVVVGTTFGRILVMQWLLLAAALAATAVLWRFEVPCVAFAGTALMLEAGRGHAYAMGHAGLIVTEALHLLAAGTWLGGLIPLFVVIASSPPEDSAVVAHRFSSIAAAAVAALVVTAAIQAYALGGGVTGLTGTAYGVTLMVKTLLFTAMLAFAAQNRLALVPSLTQDGSRVRSRLLRNIAAETVLCLLVVLAAALLSSFEPGLHAAGH